MSLALFRDAMGPAPARKRAEEEGIRPRTLDRAREPLGVDSKPSAGAGSPWIWGLPEARNQSRQSDVRHVGETALGETEDTGPDQVFSAPMDPCRAQPRQLPESGETGETEPIAKAKR